MLQPPPRIPPPRKPSRWSGARLPPLEQLYPAEPLAALAPLALLWLLGATLAQLALLWPGLHGWLQGYLYVVALPAGLWVWLGIVVYVLTGRLHAAGRLMLGLGALLALSALPIILGSITAGLPPSSAPEAYLTSTPVTPSPVPTPTPLPRQMVASVRVDDLSIRDGPGTFFSRVASANTGDLLLVIGRDEPANWLQVALNAELPPLGWVDALSMQLPAEPWGLPVVEP